jgi:hypothetical protein
MTLPPAIIRLARIVAVAVIIGVGISELWFAVTGWTQSDATAYWHAAQRLRASQPLYPVVSDVEASDVYRYAPWFAWLAVPFTFLPVQIAAAIWSAILVAASVLAVVPLARQNAWLQVAFFFPILIGISAYGNVQALMIASLAWFVGRRSGPLWVGIAASLKIFPILFVLTYLGRREWLRAIAGLVVAALLWAPALFLDMRGYVTDVGQAGLFGAAVAYYIVAGVCVVTAVVLARTRFAWVASAIAVILVASRFFIYDLTYLLADSSEERTPD